MRGNDEKILAAQLSNSTVRRKIVQNTKISSGTNLWLHVFLGKSDCSLVASSASVPPASGFRSWSERSNSLWWNMFPNIKTRRADFHRLGVLSCAPKKVLNNLREKVKHRDVKLLLLQLKSNKSWITQIKKSNSTECIGMLSSTIGKDRKRKRNSKTRNLF